SSRGCTPPSVSNAHGNLAVCGGAALTSHQRDLVVRRVPCGPVRRVGGRSPPSEPRGDVRLGVGLPPRVCPSDGRHPPPPVAPSSGQGFVARARRFPSLQSFL